MALVVASCAPKPEPITVDVVYDKFGNAVVHDCRPSTIPPNPNCPERLPICEDECPPGTQPDPNTTTAAGLAQCVPISDDSDTTNRQRGPNG